jgi:tetratricopeptide (TPR) repeat protein
VSSGSEVREDPVKLHKAGTSLYDSGKYKEAIEKFMKASSLYEKVKNFFDASYTLFKAAECSFLLKDYDTAIERFVKSADIALEKGYDRFGLGALEYALDSHKAKGKEKDNEVAELKKKISEVKKKIESSAF